MHFINFVIHRSRPFKLNQVEESAHRSANRGARSAARESRPARWRAYVTEPRAAGDGDAKISGSHTNNILTRRISANALATSSGNASTQKY